MGITYEKKPIKYVSIIQKESLIPTKKTDTNNSLLSAGKDRTEHSNVDKVVHWMQWHALLSNQRFF